MSPQSYVPSVLCPLRPLSPMSPTPPLSYAPSVLCPLRPLSPMSPTPPQSYVPYTPYQQFVEKVLNPIVRMKFRKFVCAEKLGLIK